MYVVLIQILILLFSFYLLAVIINEYFLHSVSYISKKIHIHSDVAGATLLAAGSSAPELFISLIAVIVSGRHENIGISTIIGSSMFNMLVIIGISSLFNHAKLTWQAITRDLLFYAVSIVMLLYVLWDGRVSFFESFLFIAVYGLYIFSVVRWEKWFDYKYHDLLNPHIASKVNKEIKVFGFGSSLLASFFPKDKRFKAFFISVGLIGVISYVMVESAVSLSASIGVPEGVIALTILAVGTSIPDLLSSIFVSAEGRGDMAISNAIGSNVFNILIGLGMPWIFALSMQKSMAQSEISFQFSNVDLLAGILILFLVVMMVLGTLVFNNWKISKNVSSLLIFAYVIFVLYIIGDALLSV